MTEDIGKIIAVLDEGTTSTLNTSNCIETMLESKHKEIISRHRGRLYLLLPKRFDGLNLQGDESDGPDRFDCGLLTVMILVRTLVRQGRTPKVLFDWKGDLLRFQHLSTHLLEIGEYGRTPITTIDTTFPRYMRFCRNNTGPLTFCDLKPRSHYPLDSTTDLQIGLIRESNGSERPDLIVYFKRRSQFYESGFPRIKSAEYDIETTHFGEEKTPLVIVTAQSVCIPRNIAYFNPICLALGERNEEKIKFKPVSTPYSAMLSGKNARIGKIYSNLPTIRNTLHFSELLLRTIYDSHSFVEYDIDNAELSRVSESVAVREQARSLLKELADRVAINKPLNPRISGWKDIEKVRYAMQDMPISIEYYPELEPSLRQAVEVVFCDVLTVNKLLKLSKECQSYDELMTRTTSLLKSQVKLSTEEHEQDSFDPEEPVGYVAGSRREDDGLKVCDAWYFVLENEGKTFVFYCDIAQPAKLRISGKSEKKQLRDLKIGDVIEKNYWNYRTLRTRILQYLEENELDDAEKVIEDLEISDKFREHMEKLAGDHTRSELNSRIVERDVNVKHVLHVWANETMCPNRLSFSLFTQIVQQLDCEYSLQFDPKEMYSRLRRIKKLRMQFAERSELDRKTYYKIIEGPIKTQASVERLGKIYQLS